MFTAVHSRQFFAKRDQLLQAAGARLHWQHTYGLPLPDVRWHDRLFNPFRVPPSPSPSTP